MTPVALILGGCCLTIVRSRTRRARAPRTYFALDLVYNLVFKFGLEKYTARQLMTSKLKISLGSGSCSHPRRDTMLQELTFAR